MKHKILSKAARLLTVTLMLFCWLTPNEASAQSVPVTLNMQNVRLEQVLNSIEKQTTYLFVYDKDVDVARTVSINVTKTPLKTVLDQLFAKTNITYAIESTSIILSVKSPKAEKKSKITGVVTDATGAPVIGAAVLIKGTTAGTSSLADGSFTLNCTTTDNSILVVNSLGYETQEMVIGTKSYFKITLKESSLSMDEVVVTALGIKRSEKALSYNVQKVAQDDITTVKDANFINSLSGKVAGVNINASSSGVGGASKVVMRGTKGIDQSSNALYVIDGVPMYSLGRDASKDSELASAGSTEPIADINPEDIESISVLTGAAAAALYGSHASNGAIVVTTKKGKAGKPVVTVTSNTEIVAPFIEPQFQNRYGTGTSRGGVDAPHLSWGKLLNGSNYMGYSPMQDYVQTGVVGTETVSLSVGNERNQAYVSAGAVNSRGIIPNNSYDRYNFNIRNTTSFLDDRMTLDAGFGYVRQGDMNMINQGIYSNPLVMAYLFPRGEDWNDIKMFERYDSERKIYTQYWPLDEGKSGFAADNPYWANYRNLRDNKRDRYMANIGLSYNITDWLSVAGRLRFDNSINDYTERLFASTNTTITEGSSNGYYGTTTTKDKQMYGDAILNINKSFGKDWTLQANIGGSFSHIRQYAIQNRGPISETGIPNLFNVFQLDNTKTKRIQSGWREMTQSVFASVEVGFKNAYYITLTGRNDWPSQLSGEQSVKKSFFYPSVGGSVVLSEILPMPEQISYMKIRGSYASVGLPFARFLANPTYQWNDANKVWELETFYPIYDLKPERTNSWEVGLTMRFLKHFNLDVSYYDTKTFNQTFDPKISASGGYSKFYVQTGNVQNRGVELSLGYSNNWKDFTWNSNYTLSSNQNKILELVDNYIHPLTGEPIHVGNLDVGGLGDARFILKPGGSLGDLYSLIDLERDQNGNIYVDENGEIASVSKIGDIKLGSVFPKANMAWRNDFSWKGLNFGFMFSARIGGIVYSATQAIMDRYGVSEASAAARDRGGVFVEGNTIPAQVWYEAVGAKTGVPQYYTYSATNVRLQEANIGYTFSKKQFFNIGEITLSVVGRNLWMIYNKAPFDPESVARTGNYYQGIDYFMMPSTRNIGFNVRLKF